MCPDLEDAQDGHLDEICLAELLNGLLPSERVQAILAHTRACLECEERLRVRAAEFEEWRSVPVPGREPARPRRARIVRLPVALGGVAAVAALLLVFLWPRHAEVRPDWLPAPAFVDLRADSSVDSALVLGIEAYSAHDAEAAVRHLRASQARGEHAAVRDLYLASALTQLQRWDEAMGVLERLTPASLPHAARAQAAWIRFVALSALGREAEAGELLESLREDPGWAGERARARLGG